MQYKANKYSVIAIAAGMLIAGQAQAFNMGNIMNPSRWFGGNRGYDRYDDYGPGYGGYGPGYGGYGPGYGGYGYPGYGGGYGYPGYGGGYGYPGYGVPATGYAAPAPAAPTYSTPQTDSSAEAEEIQRLKERVKELERGATQPPSTYDDYGKGGAYYPSQPGYGSGQSGSQTYQPYGGQSGTRTYQPNYGDQSQFKVK
jgi:hypothetical protein